MNKIIDIGTKINLPELLTSRLLIQANSGGGKSAIARGIIEKSHGIVPYIVMDWDGEYYTLKEKFADVLVIGGQYGDIPISLKSAKLLPRMIISNMLSVVIDLSDLKDSERILYAKYFLESLMDLPKEFWVSYLIFLEESHKLCGQQDKYESGPAVKDLMSRGRKKGYCGILLTQRISKLHKDAAAECNNKFIGRTFLDLDLNRAADELALSNKSERLKLRDLKPGQFYAMGTALDPIHVHEVQIIEPQTKMPKAGQLLDIKPQKPTDKIKAMLAKLNDLPAEAQKELKTVQDLQKEVARLNSELKKKPAPAAVTTAPNAGQTTKLAEQKEQILHMQNLLKTERQVNMNLHKAIDVYENKLSDVSIKLTMISDKLTDLRGVRLSHVGKSADDNKIPETGKIVSKNATNVQKSEINVQKSEISFRQPSNPSPSNGSLPPGEKAVLIACAQFGHALAREQLTVLTGYTRSSRNTYIQRLAAKGFVTVGDSGIEATVEGVQALGGNYGRLPTGSDLQQYWYKKLQKGEAAILKVLVDAYPDAVDREKISEETGYTRSSRNTYIQRMSAKEILTVSGSNIRASENLFD